MCQQQILCRCTVNEYTLQECLMFSVCVIYVPDMVDSADILLFLSTVCDDCEQDRSGYVRRLCSQ